MSLIHGKMLSSQLSLAAVVLLLATSTMLAAAQAQAPAPECKKSCGTVSIPYPFGLTDGCYLYVPGQDSQQFKLACNTTASQPTLNFLDRNNFPTIISNIFAGESALQVMVTTSRNCYNNNTYNSTMYRSSDLYLPPSYTLADKNKLYNIGCNKATKLQGYPLHVTNPELPYEVVLISGVSFCQDEFGKTFPDTCTGVGCSVNSIPSGLQNFTVDVWTLGTGLGTTEQWGLSYPCSYSFVVDERNFTFAGNRSFVELNNTREELPVLVNWAIGNDNCEAAKKKNETAFACKGVKTKCVDRADGYFCQCEDGYQGNPYLLDNCRDIDECKNNATLCSAHATCKNLFGGYKCDCHKGYRKDDNDKNKCVLLKETTNKNDKVMKVTLGVCLSFLVVVSITFWTCHLSKQSKFKKLATTYTEINGGSLLQEELQKYKGSKMPRIFTLEELKKATNNFAATQVIGRGTYGAVYKGTLPDKMVVAIKKSQSDDPTVVSQSRKQFIYELLVLSGIDHKNFVTLIGCCLESRTPMLVYEFVGNGKLHEHIRKWGSEGSLSLLPFGQRMKIAAETAASLANLHHHDSTQIQYRDVSCRISHPKTTNILLGENFTAKVSDFTASKSGSIDLKTLQATPAGQATLVYLDPEYFESHKLTEKSDVYSYGVVLVELLTSRPVVSNKNEEERHLANFFRTSMEDKHLDQILDHEIIKEQETSEIAGQVAQLAQRCLSFRGADRPTMSEVEAELKAILAKHPGGKLDSSFNIEMSYTPYETHDSHSPEALLQRRKSTPESGQPQASNRCCKMPTFAEISFALKPWSNKILVTSCVIAVLFDPLFFYIPYTSEERKCMGSDKGVQTAALIFRSVTDVTFLVHIVYQLHVAITRVSEDERLVFKYESVSRDQMIQFAKAFCRKLSWRPFLTDVLSILPLPQLLMVGLFFDIGGKNYLLNRETLSGFLLMQYVPRIYRIYLSSMATKTSSLWVKIVFNLFLYLLASHVLGSFWYFFAIKREISCWYQNCINAKISESKCTFYCHHDITAALITPELNKTLNDQCILKVPASMAHHPPFDFGMFSDVFKNDIQEKINIPQKIGYCVWWGLQNLSAFGTSLETSSYLWETIFAMFVSITGLLLFSFLIGNNIVQSYTEMQKASAEKVREKFRIKKDDTENWMQNHGLLEDTKEEIRKNIEEKLEEDINADLDDIYSILPPYTKKVIKRFVGMRTLRNVPLLSKVDGRVLKMMCDYLQPVKYQENTMVFRMGEPLDRVIFITDGIMWTHTTAIESSHSGQATGGPLATSSSTETRYLKKGDAYGHMLLQLASSSRMEFPISVANVRCHTKVEAFVLMGKDLKNIVTACRDLWPTSFEF